MVAVYELDVVSPDSLGRFVYRWYGPPDRPPIRDPDRLPDRPPLRDSDGPPDRLPIRDLDEPPDRSPLRDADELPEQVAGASGGQGRGAGRVDRPLVRDLDSPPGMAEPGLWVPEALVEWHRLAGRYTYPLSRDHVMLWPDAGRNGMVRFWEGVDDWYSYDNGAFRSGALDPEVIENDELPTGVRLSRFLVYAAVYEATYAPLHGLVLMHPAEEQLRGVKVRLRELDDGLWQWPDPDVRYYGDDDLLAHLGPDRVVIAGRHRDALGRFDGLAIEWDWDSRTL